MEGYYAGAAAVMTLALSLLISVPLCRLWKKSGIYSACRGIILYRIIRGVFVDCGWEFAAIAGVEAGLLLGAGGVWGGGGASTPHVLAYGSF